MRLGFAHDDEHAIPNLPGVYSFSPILVTRDSLSVWTRTDVLSAPHRVRTLKRPEGRAPAMTTQFVKDSVPVMRKDSRARQ